MFTLLETFKSCFHQLPLPQSFFTKLCFKHTGLLLRPLTCAWKEVSSCHKSHSVLWKALQRAEVLLDSPNQFQTPFDPKWNTYGVKVPTPPSVNRVSGTAGWSLSPWPLCYDTHTQILFWRNGASEEIFGQQLSAAVEEVETRKDTWGFAWGAPGRLNAPRFEVFYQRKTLFFPPVLISMSVQDTVPYKRFRLPQLSIYL